MPRQLSQLLRRFSSDELVFSLQLEGLEACAPAWSAPQRVSLAILVASLLLSATLMASLAQQELLRSVSEGLFIGATLFGLWLIVSLLRPAAAGHLTKPGFWKARLNSGTHLLVTGAVVPD